jgi:EAL domain-containing protein (putative c-di-GMP-specific phosphodiesterase class I)/GGDEF domain-containing protein
VLQARVTRALGDGVDLTLICVRLGGLEDIGATMGTPARKAVVDAAATRVLNHLSHDVTVVPLDSDELAVLLPGAGIDQDLVIAEQILERLRQPVPVDGVSVVTPVSIGVAAGAEDLEELLHAANLAMRQAAADGGNCVALYGHELLHQARRRLSIESELLTAVAGEQFCVHYQPIIDTRSGEVRSVEALVRWNHPTLGLLGPPTFLEAADSAGLMLEIGRQVLELACRHLTEWRGRWSDLAVAVNVSQAELLHPDFAERVLATLRRHGLPTSALHLEVTETVAVVEDRIAAALEPLIAAGVACSLDDFGTGYSSLHRLRSIAVKRLKIDKSFVDALGAEPGTGSLLTSIIAMAHSVGHCVVAEGVETSAQAAFLAAEGCDELQGYLFSRPVPADEVPSLLATRAGTIAAAGAR